MHFPLFFCYLFKKKVIRPILHKKALFFKRWLEKILLETLIPFQRKESSSVLAGLHNLTSGKNLSLLFAKVYSCFRHRPDPHPLTSMFSLKPKTFPTSLPLSDGHKAIHAWWSGSVAGRWSWSQPWRCCRDVGWACPQASWGSWLWCSASWVGYRQASAAETACSREVKRAPMGHRAAQRRTRGASGWPAGTWSPLQGRAGSRRWRWWLVVSWVAGAVPVGAYPCGSTERRMPEHWGTEVKLPLRWLRSARWSNPVGSPPKEGLVPLLRSTAPFRSRCCTAETLEAAWCWTARLCRWDVWWTGSSESSRVVALWWWWRCSGTCHEGCTDEGPGASRMPL